MNKLMKSVRAKAPVWALLFGVLSVCLTRNHASAAIIAADDFESYTQGLALSDPSQPPGGSGFSSAWDAPSAGLTATVVAGTMMAAGIDGSVNAVEVRGGINAPVGARQFSNILPNVFYVGVLLRLNEGIWDGNNTFSMYLSNGPAATAGALTFGIRNSPTGGDASNLNTPGGGHFMLRTGTGSPPNTSAVIPQAVVTGTDYYLVARYSKSGNGFLDDYDTIDLWLNPTGPGPTVPQASMTVGADTGLTSITHLFGRAAAMQTSGTVDAVWFDEVTVGSEWSDLVVPEPGTGSLAVLAITGLGLQRRRCR